MRAAIRGARLQGYLTGATPIPAAELVQKGADGKEVRVPNPAREDWEATDQQVLSYLLASVTKDVLTQVATSATAADAWKIIEDMFASQTRARSVNMRIALATTKKENSSVAEYFAKMKALGDDMAAAGRPLEDEELVEYIITGLGKDFSPIVSALCARVEPISVGELYSQLLNFETRMDLIYGGSPGSGSANSASRGRGSWRGKNQARGRGPSRGGAQSGRGGSSRGPPAGGRGSHNNNNSRSFYNNNSRGTSGGAPDSDDNRCQVCFKKNHSAAECWHRFDENFVPDQRLVAAATNSYGVDTNWYTDTGATDHMTSNLEQLSLKKKYHGGDQIHTASGTGMNISHIGRTTVRTPTRNIQLNDVLYVPQAKKNLVSVHRLTADNSVFIEFHPDFFLIKDQETKNILLRGRCHRGLYPLPAPTIKQAYNSNRLPLSRWHSRLGHPSSLIVKQVVSNNSLPYIDESLSQSVCDACQQGKSHQLPYPKSSSISKSPLELVFSDVWGHAPESVGRKRYYVSFIDDFSKFTWIYFLKHKSEVFQKFQEFQTLVERLFDRKILAMQTDWGGEYQTLNSFFNKAGIVHLVSCPHTHQQNGSAERKHRHIVEVGLSLLSHAAMPLKFWDEAFQTAVYLINRVPSKTIGHATPLERLFNQKPDYSSMRVFGCACWPHLRPYNKHKLEFRSKRCVFLGYSTLHKGYKCLDVSTGRVYISRDVIFDENIFPFTELHPNAGALLRSEILCLPSDLVYPYVGGEHAVDQCANGSSNSSNVSSKLHDEN